MPCHYHAHWWQLEAAIPGSGAGVTKFKWARCFKAIALKIFLEKVQMLTDGLWRLPGFTNLAVELSDKRLSQAGM